MSEQPTDPRVLQFEQDCIAAGTTPEAVVTAAGLHRSAWFRWKGGNVFPNMRNWDAVHSALAQHVGDRAA
jgi:hypothetical protein